MDLSPQMPSRTIRTIQNIHFFKKIMCASFGTGISFFVYIAGGNLILQINKFKTKNMKAIIILAILTVNVWISASAVPAWKTLNQPVQCLATSATHVTNSIDVNLASKVALGTTNKFQKSSVHFQTLVGSVPTQTIRSSFVYRYYFQTITGVNYVKIVKLDTMGAVLATQSRAVQANSVLLDGSRGLVLLEQTTADATPVVTRNFYLFSTVSSTTLEKKLTLSATVNSVAFLQTFNRLFISDDSGSFFMETKDGSQNYYIYVYNATTSALTQKLQVGSIPSTSLVRTNEVGLVEVTSSNVINFYESSGGIVTKTVTLPYFFGGVAPNYYFIQMKQAIFVAQVSPSSGGNCSYYLIKLGASTSSSTTVGNSNNGIFTVYTDQKSTLIQVNTGSSRSTKFFFMEAFISPQRFYAATFNAAGLGATHYAQLVADLSAALRRTFGFSGVQDSANAASFSAVHSTYLMKNGAIAKYGIYCSGTAAPYTYALVKQFELSVTTQVSSLLVDSGSYQFTVQIGCACSNVSVADFVCFTGADSCSFIVQNSVVTC